MKVIACGICGTDVKILEGKHAVGENAVLGHEFVGRVTEIGSGIMTLKVGDRVAVDNSLQCGVCEFCRSGFSSQCHWLKDQSIGIFQDGGDAEYCVLPENACYKVPDTIDDITATQVETLGTVLNGMNIVQMQCYDSVVVLGFGPAVAACSEYGDGIVNEPRRCNFDAQTWICPAEGTPPPNCLTPAEADAINIIWDGPTNPQGYRLWGGPTVGTSFGIVVPGGNGAFGFMYDYERYWVHQDPNWPWQSLAGADFVTNFTEEMKFQDLKFEETASTDSTDLDKAKNHGTKIIHYHGMADPVIIPFGSWNYVSRLFDRYGVAEAQSAGEP